MINLKLGGIERQPISPEVAGEKNSNFLWKSMKSPSIVIAAICLQAVAILMVRTSVHVSLATMGQALSVQASLHSVFFLYLK